MVLGPGGVGKTTLVTRRTEKLADGTEVKIPGLIARWKRREPDAKSSPPP
jgi:GTPase SAR1 family protein